MCALSRRVSATSEKILSERRLWAHLPLPRRRRGSDDPTTAAAAQLPESAAAAGFLDDGLDDALDEMMQQLDEAANTSSEGIKTTTMMAKTTWTITFPRRQRESTTLWRHRGSTRSRRAWRRRLHASHANARAAHATAAEQHARLARHVARHEREFGSRAADACRLRVRAEADSLEPGRFTPCARAPRHFRRSRAREDARAREAKSVSRETHSSMRRHARGVTRPCDSIALAVALLVVRVEGAQLKQREYMQAPRGPSAKWPPIRRHAMTDSARRARKVYRLESASFNTCKHSLTGPSSRV